MSGPLQFEALVSSIVDDCTVRARLDLGLDPLRRDVPVGVEFADALRCRVLEWAMAPEYPYPRAVVNEVHCLAAVMADLLEAADRAG